MRIVFTGGGTGGHFYPIIAIAEAVNDLVHEQTLLAPELYFLSPTPFDEKALFSNGISYIKIPAGKFRRYFDIRNVSGVFVTLVGFLYALVTLYRLYPDVVMSKGGFGSVPTTMAAHLLFIPVIIHESDAKPGRANLLAAHYAVKIAIAFDSAAGYFRKKDQSKIARTGIPIRKGLAHIETAGAKEMLGLEEGIPTVLILGGSLGSQRINDVVISGLPSLVAIANVIHQTGPTNFDDVKAIADIALSGNPHSARYHCYDFLSDSALRSAAGAADIVVSRAGAGTIAEISLWKKPAILIPIPEAISHDQRTNAYAYARTGAAVVLEEQNLTPHILAGEISRIAFNKQLSAQMSTAAYGFTDPDSARVLASAALTIALSHE